MSTITAKERKRQIRQRRRLLNHDNAATLVTHEVFSNEGHQSHSRASSKRHVVDDASNRENKLANGYSSGCGHRNEESRFDNQSPIIFSSSNNESSEVSNTQEFLHTSKGPIEDSLLSKSTTRRRLNSFQSQPVDGFSSEEAKSLFSVVMSRSGLPVHSDAIICEMSEMQGYGCGSFLPESQQSAPKVSNVTRDLDSSTQENTVIASYTRATSPIKSPSKKSLIKSHSSPAKSPGGYGIQKLLNTVTDFSQVFYNMRTVDCDDGSSNFGISSDSNGKKLKNVEFRRSAEIYMRCMPLKSIQLSRIANKDSDVTTDSNRHLNEFSSKTVSQSLVGETMSVNNGYYQEPVGIGLMDWSLKRRVRILCSNRYLPGSLVSVGSNKKKWQPPDEGVVHQLAIQYLSSGRIDGPEKLPKQVKSTIEESALAKWTAATMYYQHPSVHPLPSTLFLQASNIGNSNMQRHKVKGNVLNLSSFNDASTYHRVRLPGVGSMGGLGVSNRPPKNSIYHDKSTGDRDKGLDTPSMIASVGKMMEQRRCEWQESFRSMFNSWRSKLRQLDNRLNITSCSECDDNSLNGSFDSDPLTPDEVSRCSFYLIAPNQVILFRGGAGMTGDTNGMNVSSSKCLKEERRQCIIPIIVLSSATVEARSKLKSLGIKLRLTTKNKRFEWGNEDLTTETSMDKFECRNAVSEDSRSSVISTIGDFDIVNTELLALRQPDSTGREVFVAQGTKRGTISKGNSNLPLYICGDDDCDIVYELLLNTYGHLIKKDFNVGPNLTDVPLLLCRSIGPCLHTTLRTLSVSARRDGAYWDQHNNPENIKTNMVSDTMESVQEFCGPILPCALRDLMCTSMNRMVLQKHLDYQTENEVSHYGMKGERSLGYVEDVEGYCLEYCRLTMFLQTHEGEWPISTSTIGSSSSHFFNGSNIPLVHTEYDSINNSTCLKKWHECACGESLSVLSWDASHSKTTLEFNTLLSS